MSNLIKSILEYVTPSIVSKLSSNLGESEGGINKALSAFAPVILNGIINKAEDGKSASDLFNSFSSFNKSNVLDNIDGLLNEGNIAENDPKDISGNLLGSLFGSKMSSIISGISSFAGISSKSSSSLLSVIGPIIMGFLGKKISSGGLNLSSFTNWLSTEKSAINSAIPTSMSSIFESNANHKINTTPIKEEGKSWISKLWPILLALLAILAIWYFMKSCNKPGSDVPTTIDTTNLNTTNDQNQTSENNVDTNTLTNTESFSKTLSTGYELKGNVHGVESELVSFLEGSQVVDKTTWFNFDRLTFKTGSAELDMEKSKEQLTNIFEILKAFPNSNLKLGGYTDNVGNPKSNLALSSKRAQNVVAELLKMGVDKSRLEGEGYGQEHPVASNDTEEGRAQNRRISVRVTKK